ncbi:putative 2-dehydropantoate 2-reductase [Paraliobacillus sp. PM-2]|uniref:2-dehydropantoate 2-reductase n=1 Tax=Paraliobacillus sp. PM-2 TaxID=1462524 RepID=UPI00061C052E|nr:2-dehydropantoate 2-reductase [Paraliobacillus sp. PM-2]CQR47802.1 putative 2-dehydropantoate 2-reductase [Paraliobacillus sp. PM-2]
MEIGVIGGGSIGLLLASLLDRSGHQSTLFVRRKEQMHEINRNGILCLPDHTCSWVRAEQIDDLRQMDLYIVCVKQYDLCSIINQLNTFDGSVIYIQNGMGHIDLLNGATCDQTILLGTCEHGAKRQNERTVTHTGKGKINLSLFRGEQALLQKWTNSLNSDIFPLKPCCDWEVMLIDKLLINIVVNPITAIYQVKNGELLTNQYLHTLAKLVCSEASDALGQDETKQWVRIVNIIETTKENDSSMKEDITNYRKTEIEGILGYVLKRIDQKSSLIHFLYLSIKALEEKKG